MSDFKTRRKNYLKKIASNPNVVEILLSKDMKPEVLKVMICPRNEGQLEIAESVYTTIEKMNLLMEKAIEDELKSIPVEENMAIEILSNTINKLVNGEDPSPVLESLKDPKNSALYVYHMTVAMLTEPEDMIEALTDKTGFDFDDPIQRTQFKLLMSEASKIANPDQIQKTDLTDDEIKFVREYTAEFVRLCDGNNKKTVEEDTPKQFFKNDDDFSY